LPSPTITYFGLVIAKEASLANTVEMDKKFYTNQSSEHSGRDPRISVPFTGREPDNNLQNVLFAKKGTAFD